MQAASYMREWRKSRKTFSVLLELDDNELNQFNKFLESQGLSKTAWLNQKVREELKKIKNF